MTSQDLRHRLRIGRMAFDFEGLEPAEAAALGSRWGPFLAPGGAAPGAWSVRIRRGASALHLGPAAAGAIYRVEAGEHRPSFRSHHFALERDAPDVWRLTLDPRSSEPVPRLFENAARCLVARRAVAEGGLALHGAGVLRGGRAFVLAGASGAGKTTALSFAGDSPRLGDDFAVLLPSPGGWIAAAVPFDNREAAPPDAPTGEYALAGVFRLFQSAEDRLEKPLGAAAVASLLSCAALPWAMPDLAGAVAAAAERLVREGRFEHLRFTKSGALWPLVDPPPAEA